MRSERTLKGGVLKAGNDGRDFPTHPITELPYSCLRAAALAPGGQQGGVARHHLSQSQHHVGVSRQASRAQALSHWLDRARGQDKRALGQGRSSTALLRC